MYISTYLFIILCIFAIFGMIIFLLKLINTIKLKNTSCDRYSIVVSVKNAQDSIEGLIRSIMLDAGVNEPEGMFCNIVVVDKGSTDDTLAILERLAAKYSFIKLVKKNEINSFIKDFIKL